MIGETIGNHTIVRHLGMGGMGEVFLAEHRRLGTPVAIKFLLPHISADESAVRRFFNEAIAASKIAHAGIVKVFDSGFHAGRAYLMMELLDGETLASRIHRAGPLPISQLGEIGRQIVSVLEATHRAGITHRDLKPDNIFLVRDAELASGERVKILDFGIAKLTGTSSGATSSTGGMGTPAYMAPEQWMNAAKVDWRADLYSLGCVIFEMACGRPPFLATTTGEACTQHLGVQPPRLRELAPHLPEKLDTLLSQMLAKSPGARPSSLREVARTFAELGAGAAAPANRVGTSKQDPHGSRRMLVLIVAVLLGVIGLLGATVAILLANRSETGSRGAPAVDGAVVGEDGAQLPKEARREDGPIAEPRTDPADDVKRRDAGVTPGPAERPDPPSDLPAKLDRAMITEGIMGVKRRVIACGEKSAARGTVKVSVKVRPDGGIAMVDVTASPDPRLGECVARAMRAARFRKTLGGGSFSYPFVF